MLGKELISASIKDQLSCLYQSIMRKCGSPVTQVNVDNFDAVYMPFKYEAIAKINPYENKHVIMDQDSTLTTDQSDKYAGIHILFPRG